MSYLVVLNSEVVTCATSDYVLSDNDVIKLDTMKSVVETITSIKNNEEQRVTEAIRDGYIEGYEKGLVKGESDLNKQFIEYLKDLTENIILNISDTDTEIVNMACEVTRKIADELSTEEVIRNIATTAVKKIKHHKRIEIRVRPEYIQTLKLTVDSMNAKGIYNFTTLDIAADQSLGKLDCIIKTDAGVTIASFDDQLELLRQSIEHEIINKV